MGTQYSVSLLVLFWTSDDMCITFQLAPLKGDICICVFICVSHLQFVITALPNKDDAIVELVLFALGEEKPNQTIVIFATEVFIFSFSSVQSNIEVILFF